MPCLVSDTPMRRKARRNRIYYLKSFILDELFKSIDNIEMFIFIIMSNVSGVKPTITVNCLRGGFWVIQIPCRLMIDKLTRLQTKQSDFEFKYIFVPIAHANILCSLTFVLFRVRLPTQKTL